MANVTQLVDRFVEATGLDGADMRIRARYLREAGLLPASARSKDAGQVETIHTVIVMLAGMAGGPQIDTPRTVRELWRLQGGALVQRQLVHEHASDERITQLTEARIIDPTGAAGRYFGGYLAGWIDAATTPEGRALLKNVLDTITVWRDTRHAKVNGAENCEITFTPDSETWANRRSLLYRAPIENVAWVNSQLLVEMADLVLHSRDAAARRRTTIDTTETLIALGFEQQQQELPLPAPPAATTTAAPETENADPLPQGPALIRDHDRDKRDLVPVRGPKEARGVCENTQALSSRGNGQSPKRQRIDPHERQHPALASGA